MGDLTDRCYAVPFRAEAGEIHLGAYTSMTLPPSSPSSGPVASSTDVFLEQLIDFFRLLSDRTRLNILLLLRDGEKNVTTLCDRLKLPQPTVSHHLGLLRTSNLIDNRRAGKQVFYGLSQRFNDVASGALHFRSDLFSVQVHPSTPITAAASVPSGANADIQSAAANSAQQA